MGSPSPQSAASLGLPAATLPTICSLAHPSPPATVLPGVFSTWLPVLTPPTGVCECFFFNSLVVRHPYSLIFCQFWLLLFLTLLLSFWLCEESQCVYLCLSLGRKSLKLFKNCCSNTVVSIIPPQISPSRAIPPPALNPTPLSCYPCVLSTCSWQPLPLSPFYPFPPPFCLLSFGS